MNPPPRQPAASLRIPLAARLAGVLLVGALLVGCTGGDPVPDADDATEDGDASAGSPDVGTTGDDAASGEDLAGELVVFAAASLTDALDRLATSFEGTHAEVTVTLNLAGSQTLAAQLREGAPADVFVSANTTQMDVVADAGLISALTPLLQNELAIAVEPGNPLGIQGLADLARPDLVLVLAGAEVPAGRYAAEALAAAGVEVTPASYEVDVRAVLSKVALGEADAGIVYRSDVVAGGASVEGIAIPADQNVTATYPVAVLDDAPNRAAAEAFVALLRSDTGAEVFRDAGFTPLP